MRSILLLSFISLILLSGCLGPSSPPQTGTGQTLTPGQGEKIAENATSPTNSLNCPNLKVPSNILPQDCSFCTDRPSFYIDGKFLLSVDWDGWEWEKEIMGNDYSSLYCRAGKYTGENKNNLYCSGAMDQLSKSFTDDKGNIMDRVYYYMEWVYSPAGGSYKLIEIRYKDNMFDSTPDCITKYN